MEDYKKILSNTGTVLIAAGIIDALFTVYCVSHGIKYRSLFSIFAIAGGVSLLRHSLKAARIVSFFSALLFSAVIGFVVLLPINLPLKLQATIFRLHGLFIVTSLCAVLMFACLIFWIYSSLTSGAVRREIEAGNTASGVVWKRPVWGFWAGACLIIALNIIIVISKQSPETFTLIEKAKLKAGGEYQYYLTSFAEKMNGGNKNIKASILAYSDEEIKKINIEELYEANTISSISFDVFYDKLNKPGWQGKQPRAR
jgi:Na+/phosphate symporter